jgi:hypothetical protein
MSVQLQPVGQPPGNVAVAVGVAVAVAETVGVAVDVAIFTAVLVDTLVALNTTVLELFVLCADTASPASRVPERLGRLRVEPATSVQLTPSADV